MSAQPGTAAGAVPGSPTAAAGGGAPWSPTAAAASGTAPAGDLTTGVVGTPAGPAGGGRPDGLPAAPEPLSLRDAWWDAERRGVPRPDAVAAVAELAWAHWGPLLPGADAAWLAAVTGGYRRELWLWLVGERTWEQVVTGLAGRTLRRLPARTAQGLAGRTGRTGPTGAAT